MSARFAIVGCGNAARQIHLPELRAHGVEVTAFASRSRASAESVRDAWGTGAIVERWEEATTRDDAIREMALQMQKAGFIDDADKLVNAALQREAMASTALDHGLAFPHVRGVVGGGRARNRPSHRAA